MRVQDNQEELGLNESHHMVYSHCVNLLGGNINAKKLKHRNSDMQGGNEKRTQTCSLKI